MTLPIVDGNDQATNLKSIVEGGAHIVVHINRTLREQALIDGKYFRAEYDIVLGAAANYEILLVTTAEVLFNTDVFVSKTAKLEIFEDTDTSGGTSLEIVNLNRTVGGAPTTAVLSHTPAIVSDGTLIVDRDLGTSKDFSLAQESTAAGFMLKANAKYLVRLTSSESTNATTTTLELIEG